MGLAAACGGGGAGAPSDTKSGVPSVPDGVEPIESFATDQMMAYCSLAVRCHKVATMDGCMRAALPNISPQVVQDVQAGVIQYDPHLGYRCIQMIAKTACFGTPEYVVACHNAFTGTLAGGAACKLNAECTSNGCRMTGCTNQCCPPGVCAAGTEPRNIALGGDCSVIGCQEGAYCAQGKCAKQPGLGEQCLFNLCDGGLLCWNPNAPIVGEPPPTCVAPAGPGESCADRPCAGSRPSTCSANKVCVAPGAAGDACVKSIDCELDLNCVGGTCVAPGALGEACVGETGTKQCQDGPTLPTAMAVECISGTCDYRKPLNGLDCLSP
jgi:hypothetical protein